MKKRRKWSYRGGAQLANQNQVINAPGQWCLPGGRQDCKNCHKSMPKSAANPADWECNCTTANQQPETPEETAKREFKEESGVDITSYTATYANAIHNTSYDVVTATVSSTDLSAIRSTCATNTAPSGTNNSAPAVTGTNGVKDWEWGSPTTVPRAQLGNYLGVWQTLNPPINGVGNWGNHAIDWFVTIATNL